MLRWLTSISLVILACSSCAWATEIPYEESAQKIIDENWAWLQATLLPSIAGAVAASVGASFVTRFLQRVTR